MKLNMKMIDYVRAAGRLGSSAPKTGRALKIAVLRSFTCETLETILPVELDNMGIGCRIFFGGFNSFFQDTLNDSGRLYGFKPDVIIYAIRVEEIIPERCLNDLATGKGTDETSKYLMEITAGLEDMLKLAKDRVGSKIIINNFTKPAAASFGLHLQAKNGFNNFIRKLNIRLLDICADKGIHVADIDDMTAEMGRDAAYAPHMWAFAKNPYTFAFYVRLSKLYARYIYSMFFPRKKCIVLDLDNTLWNGVLGEASLDECRIYTALQKELKRLSQTGILLAIASKNNRDDVREFFRRHEAMPLKPEDFSVMKINWRDKPANILEIASELNILTDSMVFIDDNPAEREMVKEFLSDVYVVDFANDKQPEEKDFLAALEGLYCLDYLELTEEDINRNAMYRQQQGRQEYERSSRDLDSFLRGLEMEAHLFPVADKDLSRAAQLTQKTNQFNLTTKRYTDEDLLSLIHRGFLIYGLRLKDKFGEHGMTGLMIIEPADECWVIDSFLLSCRIMNRGAEYLFMSEIIRMAREKRIRKIVAAYIPTGKNKPVESLYKEMGFEERSGFWEWNCDENFNAPDYIILN